MRKYISYLAILSAGLLVAQNGEQIVEIEKKAYNHSNAPSMFHRSDSPEVIDVYQYDLYFNITPSEDNFSGTSVSYFTALENTSQVTLDADNTMTISQVKYNGNELSSYTHSSNVLTISLPSELSTGTQATIEVSYSASYNGSEGIFKNTHNGEPLISTLSEPFGASGWWVGKDNLKDKTQTTNIYVTHPSSLKAGSNGTLQSVTDLGNGNSQTHWQHSYAIPAYLISVCVTNYVEYNNTANVSGQTVPVINYIYPESNTATTQTQLDAVPSFIEYISGLVGDYPYKNEKYGHCQWEWGGGMEHSTMSSQVNFETALTAHELAHQWFGDKITCATWSDIWLNEGFASYFEGLVQAHLYGDDFFSGWKSGRVDFSTIFSDGSVYIPAEEATTSDRIFDYSLSYCKGAMVLNMLRFRLGDEDFFQAISNYLVDTDLAYSFATTEELKTHLEETSGDDLDEFFADWVYGEGYPIFSVNFASGGNNGTLEVSQTTSDSSVDLFETHFDVKFTGTDGNTETRKFFMNQTSQEFSVSDLPFTVASYQFNPKSDIVCLVNSQTMGTQNIELKTDAWNLYPNPVENMAGILSDEMIEQIEVYNLAGKKLISKQVDSRGTDLFVGQLPSGVYLVKALIDGKWSSKKLIKK